MVLCFGFSIVVYMQYIVATNMISDHIRKYYFVSSMDHVEVLGWYEDVAGQPPAILRANHGKGYAVLSGVHLEIGPNNAGPEISADIKVTDKLRLQLLAKLLNFKQN